MTEPQTGAADSTEQEKYHLVVRDNACVVCSTKEEFARFSIVPTLYRAHFPNTYKSHSTHDVMLLCFQCQERAQRYQYALKKYISRKLNVKLDSQSDKKNNNTKISKIKWAVGLLQSVGGKLPVARRGYLRSIVLAEVLYLSSV